ncbi:efflux RND transporter periplasmic adaptor subunit [Billgrantia sulfidoxydans]|uniref:Efflux RND transporter periplasmic adaptor subunit n=1 Tax=Billgrantia sulfidoxydans TaxID=2733484 RepID=A0ABX7W2H5_9GAMM|nr:efflux RND transporter periplasmic adaptor subunit [Halomonas sulfidoxydans]QTP54355.1 efflux RND transporter periplasmic adaptor subunit [Halomonas sulfidoxydans]
MKRTSRLGRATLMVLAASLLLAACGQEENPEAQQQAAAQRQPHPVEVVAIERQDIALEKSYPSLLRSDDEVTLVARITGNLEERHFEPGEQVERGQRLFSIEPDVYQAAVNQHEANLQSAQAELSRAQRDAERFERLLSQNSVSQQQVDQARAELGVARAAVAQAEAALASARIDLAYAEVAAPVSGVIGLAQINVGNLVSPGTVLATITPLDPLEVRFQLPQRDALELRQQLNGRGGESIRATLNVPGGSGAAAQQLEGQLDFLGSRVDERTSTVQASASFANLDTRVLPGQFARVSLEGLKRFDVLAVPEIAVTQGLMGPQVFVLDEDDVARSRTVELGEVAGPWQIVRGGLEPGERVVVGDPAGIEPGTPIDPRPFEGDAETLVEEVEQAEAEAERQAAEAMQEQEAAEAMPGEDAAEGGEDDA